MVWVIDTVERRPIGWLKSQVIFRKRATNYRALLRRQCSTVSILYDRIRNWSHSIMGDWHSTFDPMGVMEWVIDTVLHSVNYLRCDWQSVNYVWSNGWLTQYPWSNGKLRVMEWQSHHIWMNESNYVWSNDITHSIHVVCVCDVAHQSVNHRSRGITSHVTCDWVTLHISEWVMSHTTVYIIAVVFTQMNESWYTPQCHHRSHVHTYEWVTSHTNEWVMSHTTV